MHSASHRPALNGFKLFALVVGIAILSALAVHILATHIHMSRVIPRMPKPAALPFGQ